jgi:hypothetical protein
MVSDENFLVRVDIVSDENYLGDDNFYVFMDSD